MHEFEIMFRSVAKRFARMNLKCFIGIHDLEKIPSSEYRYRCYFPRIDGVREGTYHNVPEYDYVCLRCKIIKYEATHTRTRHKERDERDLQRKLLAETLTKNEPE